MAYIIFGDSFTFPEGDAATNRVYTYAKGFEENGILTHVVAFRDDYLVNHTGETEGIKYYHPFARTERSPSFLVRRWQKILKYFNTLMLFRELDAQGGINLITVYTTRFNTHLFAWYLSRKYKAKLVKECSEHPLRLHQRNTISRLTGMIKFKLETYLCDGIFCISEYLIDFCRVHAAGSPRLFKVPSTVDVSRFEKLYPSPMPVQYICYCGSLTMQKDGVDILITAYKDVVSRFNEIHLVLVGKADTDEDERYLRSLVSDLNLSHKVIFTGKLPRNEIPQYTCNAKILVLARPRSLVADAGFPSKLTEYLATGNPVVATDVGEIPTYLSDGKNAYIAEAGSSEAFSGKLIHILENYEEARATGINGRDVALTLFNYRYQSKRVIQFISSLE